MLKGRMHEVKFCFSACEIHVNLEIIVLDLKESHSKSLKENAIYPDWGLPRTTCTYGRRFNSEI